MRNPTARGVRLTALVLILAFTGCHRSMGPKTIPRDRFGYTNALADSWKSQMLLNVVKTRYLDLPIYLDVGQIVSGYSLETGVNVFGQASPKSMRGDTFAGLNAHGTYIDRPTITYTPMTGDKFLQSFLSPVNPVKVFSLVQAGYPADFILELSLDSLNGLRNRPVNVGARQQADPAFFRVISLMNEIQDAGAVGMRIDQPTSGQPATILFLRSENVDPATQAKMAELRQLLGVPLDQSTFRLVQSPLRGAAGDLSVSTRSLAQIMAALSQGVEVPASHEQRKIARPLPDGASTREDWLLRVHSGKNEPADAFAAVPYEGEWFWISNDDWKSKRTFSSLLFLFTLTDSGDNQKLPTITIPAQ